MKVMDAIVQAHFLVGLGRLDDAFETLELLGVTAEASPGAIYLQASIAMWAERWHDASLLLGELLQLPTAATELRIGEVCLGSIPHRPRVRLELARCLIGSGRIEDAARVLEAEDVRDEARVLQARIALEQRRPDIALARFGSHRESWAALDRDAARHPEVAALLGSHLVN